MTLPESTIVAIEARRLDVAMKKPFGIAGGAQAKAANVLVTVTLAGGVVGYGEAAPFPAFNGETQADALSACGLAKVAIEGGDVRRWEALAEPIRDACGASAAGACAIETAVVDALAKLRGVSLRAFFGGAEETLVTDITITTGSEADAEREAREFAAFGTLKIKVGGGDVDRDVARVIAVRRARPDAKLMLDANGGFSADDAIRFIAELARHGVVPTIFEQPIAAGSFEALAEVRARTGVPIAIDESVTRAADVDEAHRLRAADAVNVKITKSGIREAVAIAERARHHGLGRMIGGMVETRLAMGTSACIAAGLGGFTIVDLDTPLFLAEDPFDGGYTQQGERLDLRPIGLGHGLRPKEKTTSPSPFPSP